MDLTRREFALLTAAFAPLGLGLAKAQDTQDDSSDQIPSLLPAGVNLATRVVSPIHLNDQGPFLFVVDTGAGRTAIAADLVARLGLQPGPTVRVHGIVGAASAPTARLSALRLARHEMRDLVLPIFSRDRLGADGLLGLDVLGRYRLTFDMMQRQVSLLRPGRGVALRSRMTTSRLGGDNVIEGRRRYGPLIVTDVWAEDLQVAAFVDSGSQYSVGNHALMNSVAVRRPTLLEGVEYAQLHGVTGQSRTAELARLTGLRIGNVRIDDIPVFFADIHAFDVWGLTDQPALILGADVMRRFESVVLDFPANQITVGRPHR